MFEIAYASGMPKEIVKLDGQALIDPKSFFKAIISKTCGGTFTGSAGNLKYLVDRWLGTRIPTIASVPYIGYVPSLGRMSSMSTPTARARRSSSTSMNILKSGKRASKRRFPISR